MTTTETLASLIGLYFAAAGIGLLVDRDGFSAAMKELPDHPMLGYLGAILAFVIGGAIIGVHNNWDGLLSGFVSLIGWLSLAEGVAMLAFRKTFLGFFARMALSPGVIAGFGVGTLAAGILLLIAAFAGV